MQKPLKIGKCYSLALSPAGTRLAVLARSVSAWDLIERRKLYRCHPCCHPSDACFSPDGTCLAIKNTAGLIVIVSACDGHLVANFDNASDGEGSNVAYSACGEYLADGSWEGWLRVRRAADGEVIFQQQFPDEMITSVHRDGTGNCWVIEHQPKTRPRENFSPPAYFSVWEWPFWQKARSVLPYRIHHLRSSALSHDATHLAIVRQGNPTVLEIYRVPEPALLGAVSIAIGGTPTTLRWSPDGRWLGSTQENRTVIYRLPQLSIAAEFPLSYACDVAFCSDLKLVVLGDWEQGLVTAFES